MIFKTGLIMFWLCISVLYASEYEAVTFQELSKFESVESASSTYQGRKITVRGFLYKSSNGNWILSGEPNLKTCCVGSPRKVWRQIIVDGDFELVPSGHVAEVEGSLFVDPKWNDKQELRQVYHLKDARLVKRSEKANLFAIVLAAIGLLGLISFAFRIYYKRKV